jgi:hypothetical protein
MYIKLTNIDANTKILCTQEPMRTGPTLPAVKGFQYNFTNESIYPIDLNADGSYAEMPLYYGVCDDDADTAVVGVVSVLTEEEFNADKEAEHLARKPFPSWVGDVINMLWEPPVPYPQDGKYYYWDEETTSWKLVTDFE